MRGPLHITDKLLKKSLAVGLLLALSHAGAGVAAGLGKINVLSRYGEPFHAEIDLINVTRDELATLNASLAPTSAYQAANLRVDPALNSLRLTLERRENGAPFVRASTTRRVYEPYVDLLVDLTWHGGKFQRHYAALVDLPAGGEAAARAAAPPPAPPTSPLLPSTPQVARSPATPPAPVAVAPSAAPADRLPPLRTLSAPKPAIKETVPPLALAPAASAKAAPATGAQTPPPTPAKASETAAAPANPNAAPAMPPKAGDPAKPADAAASAAAPVAAMATTPATSATPAETQPGEAKPEAKSAPEAAPASAPVPPPPVKTAPAVTPPPAQRGILAALMDYWVLGVGVLLALLAALIGFLFLRRRSSAPPQVEPLAAPPAAAGVAEAPREPAPAASANRAGMDTTAPPADEAEAGPKIITVANSSEMVDPLDEAKVYVAYGQYEEAEKVLRAALSKQRGREDVQLTLLQILAEQGDKEGFHKIAGDMHKRTGGRGENWKRAAAMGYALDPDHPLYPPTEEAVQAAEAARRAAESSPAETVVFDLTTPEGQAEAQGSQGTPLPASADSVLPDEAKTLGRAGVETVNTEPPLSDIVIAIPQAAAPAVGAAEAPPVKDFAPLDFKVEFPKAEPAPPPVKLPDDVFEFKLDVPDATPPQAPAIDHATAKPADDLPVIDGVPESAPDAGADEPPKDEHWHDVQQKFDLVRAYQEMGDQDGVREVLGEIVSEGDAGQQAEARKLLAVLD